MRPALQPVDRCCRGIAVVMAALTRWLLVLLAIGQGVGLYFLLREEPLPVPQTVVGEVQALFAREGFRFEAAQMSFDVRGGFYASESALYLEDQDVPLLEADGIFLQASILPLLTGQLELASLELVGGEVYLPPALSRSGQAEAVIRDAFARITLSPRNVELSKMRFRWDDLTVNAHGIVPRATLQGSGPNDALAEDRRTLVVQLWDRLLQTRKRLADFENPTLDLDFTLLGADRTRATFNFRADSYSIGEWALETLQASSGSFLITPEHMGGTVRLGAARLTGPQGQVRQFRGELWLRSDRENITVQQARVAAGNVTAQGLHFPATYATLGWDPDGHLRANGSLTFGGGVAPFTALLDLDDQSGTLHLRVTPQPDFLATLAEVDPRLATLPLSMGARPYLRLEAQLDPGFQFREAKVFAVLADLVAAGVSLDFATAWGTLYPDRAFLDHFHAVSEKLDVTGSIEQSLNSAQHRLYLRGSVIPSELNPWLQDWWDNIWEDLLFHGDRPLLDMAMQGYWKEEQGRLVKGSARGENAAYRGLLLETCSFDFFALPGASRIENLQAVREEGVGTGSLSWINIQAEPKLVAFHLDLDAPFAPSAALPTLGDNWGGIGENILFEEPPTSSLRGRMLYRPGEDFHAKAVRAELRSEAPGTIYEWPLDSLTLVADRVKSGEADYLDLPTVDATAFAGNLAARARIDLTDLENPDLDLALTLTDTELREVILTVEAVRGSAEEEEPVEPTTERYGDLDVQLALSGPLQDFWSTNGTGSFQISEGNLAQLRLFGLLSRAIEVVPFLTFSTLNIKEGGGEYSVANGQVVFPDLRFTGDGTEIIADGTVQMPESELDFEVELHLLRKSETPLVILSPILYPLAKALEVRLGGTLEEPSWRLALFSGTRPHQNEEPAIAGP